MPPAASVRRRTPWPLVLWGAVLVLAGLAASLALWDPLDLDERAHIAHLSSQAAASVRSDIQADIQVLLQAQVRHAAKWAWEEPLQRPSSLEWTLNSRLLMEHYPCYVSMQLVDAEFRPRWRMGRDGQSIEAPDIGVVDDAARALLERIARPAVNGAVLTPGVRLPDGRLGVLVVVPVARGAHLTWRLVTTIDARAMLESMLTDHLGIGYSVLVRDADGAELFRSAGAAAADDPEWADEAPVSIPGATWRVRVWPTVDMRGEIRSSLPELAAVLGGLLGSALVLTLYLGRTTRAASRALQRARDELESRVTERTTALQEMNRLLEVEIARRAQVEESLRNLSGRLLRLQDEERRRIARELHDSTTQMLATLAMNVSQAQVLTAGHPDPRLPELLQSCEDALNAVTLEIRTVSYLLHPPILDELGLDYVLQWYVSGFTERSGVRVALEVQSDLGRLPDEIELTLFRIVQEGLSNVHRHSNSSTVRIALSRDSDTVRLEIADEGRGFPAALLESDSERTPQLGVGIAGMRERVRQLGGTFHITSRPTGTTVSATLPLPSSVRPA